MSVGTLLPWAAAVVGIGMYVLERFSTHRLYTRTFEDYRRLVDSLITARQFGQSLLEAERQEADANLQHIRHTSDLRRAGHWPETVKVLDDIDRQDDMVESLNRATNDMLEHAGVRHPESEPDEC